MESADVMLVGFKSHLRVQLIPQETVWLISEQEVTTLSGPSVHKLAPLLDGTRTAAQIRYELADSLPAVEVDRLLGQLSAAGIIKTFPKGFRERAGNAAAGETAHPCGMCPADQTVAYWDQLGLDSHHATSALSASAVTVIATGSTDREAAALACQESGLSVHDAGSERAAFSLVLCDDYLDQALAGINAEHIARRRPWLLCRPAGKIVWIGPIFRPGAGPCWACLARRLTGNRPAMFLALQAAEADAQLLQPPAVPASTGAGLRLAVLETLKWLAGLCYEEQQEIRMLDTMTLHTERHAVARRPQCRVCGDPSLVAARVSRPIELVARTIDGNQSNGQRTTGLDQVLSRYRHLIDPFTGIVPELRRHPSSPAFIHAYLSGRNRAMTESSFAGLRAGLREHSGGKGVTDLEAQVGAMCEAVERYCATRDGDEPTVLDSYRGLGSQAVHPDACQLFHHRQFAERAHWNAECAPWHRVPERFDEDAVTEWTPMWSLLSDEQRLLPTGMLYFSANPGPGSVATLADSNGNAAGTCLEDAVMQAFFELVERDAVALWWYNRTQQPAVDLNSFDDPWAAGLPEQYRRMNRRMWVLDVTSDLGIPVMAAISKRIDKPREDIVFGFGAHPDPHIALSRALTELGQMLPPVANVTADGGGYPQLDKHLLSWWTRSTTQSEGYLLPDPAKPARTAGSYGYVPTQILDPESVCAVARHADLDILVLDQTRPDIGMPVVKVVVPGLRHFWPRFAAGRLYDVPVRLGRLAEPTAYENLNPVPILI